MPGCLFILISWWISVRSPFQLPFTLERDYIFCDTLYCIWYIYILPLHSLSVYIEFVNFLVTFHWKNFFFVCCIPLNNALVDGVRFVLHNTVVCLYFENSNSNVYTCISIHFRLYTIIWWVPVSISVCSLMKKYIIKYIVMSMLLLR